MATANKFAADFKRALANAGARAHDVAGEAIKQVGVGLVMASPVGDPALWQGRAPPGYVGGTFRANWQHGLNTAPGDTLADIDAEGDATIARNNASVDAARGTPGKHYFVNNLPYAAMLEYGGHSSQVPPGGMVGLAVLHFQSYVQQASVEA